MSQEEVEAVLGHEVAHVANGDMVTLTLIQGVLNTFVIFLARIVGTIVDRTVFRSERGVGPGYYITVFVLEIVFAVLASLIVAWFSRRREFRADRGSASTSVRRGRWRTRSHGWVVSRRVRCRRRSAQWASPTVHHGWHCFQPPAD